MRKKIIGIMLSACLFAPVSAQRDTGGETAFRQLEKEYRLGVRNSVAAWEDYLEQYPDSRHTNEVRAYIGSTYYQAGRYGEAIAQLKSCDIEHLADDRREKAILQLAHAYLKDGRMQDAKVWYTLLQDIGRQYRDEAAYNLAYIAYREKQYDKALENFRSLQNNKAYEALVPYYIGETLLEKGDYRQAQATAEDYLQRFAGEKDEAEMKRILGEAHFGQNRYQQAVAPLEQYCSAVGRPQRKALYDLGMSYYQNGAYSKAAAVLGEVASTDDALTQHAYLNRGLAYLNLKERNQARMAFEQASTKDYDKEVKEQALYNYALCVHETAYSPFAESVTVFERFLNEFPNSPYIGKVQDYLIEVYMNTRSYDAALRSIEKIEHPGERMMEAKQKLLFRRGTQSFANSDFKGAIDYFDRSLTIGRYQEKTKADAYYWRGESHYRLERYAQANDDFRQYLSLATDKHSAEYGLALYNLGYTCFKQKNYAEALAWFNRFVADGATAEKSMRADAHNRIGDCNFYERRFDVARQHYNRARDIDPALGDYSLYQEAFVQGLQRDYTRKIQTLNSLLKDYPESRYADEALYEQGRAFVQLEDNARAIERYQLLVDKFPGSRMARKASNEIGLLYYQDDNYPQAIRAYQKVIRQYPGSEEARLAQRDLKSIYTDMNKVDEYADFAAAIPGGVNFDTNERDSLTFVAAEQVYMKGDTTEAKESFTRYLQSFPEGAFCLNANYYIGLIDYNQKRYDSASLHLDKVLAYPDNKFSEEAMVMNAEIASDEKDYEKALSIYNRLKERATAPERRQDALLGALRCAAALHDAKETIAAAGDLLNQPKLSPELANEARFDRAKAYSDAGNTEGAVADWKTLGTDTRNVYGAEAKYRLAQAYFDAGHADSAEQEILDYIHVSTPHAYWLARSFILLSDIYMKSGRELDAKQYLLSLQQNYRANDDIAEMIASRLNKLENK